MKLIDERCEPQKVLSKDPARPHLCHAWLDVQAKLLFATNGMAGVAVPVTVDPGDRDGYVTRDALKAMARGVGVACRKGLIVAGNVLFKRNLAKAAHPLAQVGNRSAIFPARVRGDKRTVSVGLNPNLLVDLAKAMGARDGVVLTFDPANPTEPLVVSRNGGYGDEPDRVMAVLMPMRFDTPEKRR